VWSADGDVTVVKSSDGVVVLTTDDSGHSNEMINGVGPGADGEAVNNGSDEVTTVVVPGVGTGGASAGDGQLGPGMIYGGADGGSTAVVPGTSSSQPSGVDVSEAGQLPDALGSCPDVTAIAGDPLSALQPVDRPRRAVRRPARYEDFALEELVSTPVCISCVCPPEFTVQV